MERKIYFAYGSNLNHEQMSRRCPDAVFIGATFINDYTMTFKGDSVGVADIIPQKGSRVPVGIWSITEADERALDRYEGFPRLYSKRKIRAYYVGKTVEGMVYVMAADKPVQLPSEAYFNVILQGYLDCGIDTAAFFEFVGECKHALI
ncbi:MAG: gamma-glutamylcyclotransferase [Ruminococcus sp.]|nr:gamma-glutamylcyclotransferase [Ruminococcus sp.]